MPATNTKALAKGPSLDADAIIIDLEDSVAPSAKGDARNHAVAAIRDFDYAHRQRILRVNAFDSEWFDDDLAALQHISPHAILLPKVEHAQTIVDVCKTLTSNGVAEQVGVWAMLETPKAVLNAADIAHVAEQCERFDTICIGNNDLAREAGMQVTSERHLLLPWLMQILLAAKAYGLNVLDGVYNDFHDASGLAAECVQGAAMGMNGKTLIHPNQILMANQAYSPSALDIDQAQAIVDAFADPANRDAGVLQIDGRMVERLHLAMAQQTLVLAKRIEGIR